jgi:PHD/YefM family antitoxin component YafN of YafNO toxin-antitoxin module
MTDLTNSHSLTDFQRNARAFITGLNETKEPMLLTVNGKVQAVLVDPASYRQLEAQMERQRFIAALKVGERAIQDGRVRPADQARQAMQSKYGF